MYTSNVSYMMYNKSMNQPTVKYSLDELCTLVGLPKRTLRFYIQNGLLDRPEGAKRGAYYLQRHLEQLLEIQKWQKAGLSLERIKELLAGPSGPLPPPRRRRPGDVEVWSHLYLGDGIELHIEPRQANLSPEQIRELARGVQVLVEQLAGQGAEGSDVGETEKNTGEE